MEKYIHANTKRKTAGVVILTEKKNISRQGVLTNTRKTFSKTFL